MGVEPFAFEAFHRLIPSRFSEIGTVLEDIADSERMLADIVLLDGAPPTIGFRENSKASPGSAPMNWFTASRTLIL